MLLHSRAFREHLPRVNSVSRIASSHGSRLHGVVLSSERAGISCRKYKGGLLGRNYARNRSYRSGFSNARLIGQEKDSSILFSWVAQSSTDSVSLPTWTNSAKGDRFSVGTQGDVRGTEGLHERKIICRKFVNKRTTPPS